MALYISVYKIDILCGQNMLINRGLTKYPTMCDLAARSAVDGKRFKLSVFVSFQMGISGKCEVLIGQSIVM